MWCNLSALLFSFLKRIQDAWIFAWIFIIDIVGSVVNGILMHFYLTLVFQLRTALSVFAKHCILQQFKYFAIKGKLYWHFMIVGDDRYETNRWNNYFVWKKDFLVALCIRALLWYLQIILSTNKIGFLLWLSL